MNSVSCSNSDELNDDNLIRKTLELALLKYIQDTDQIEYTPQVEKMSMFS